MSVWAVLAAAGSGDRLGADRPKAFARLGDEPLLAQSLKRLDDSDWRSVDLPHDWAVEGPYDAKENASQGYRARGIGWYRRYLKLPEADRGRNIELQFDAIATHSTVWINGIVATLFPAIRASAVSPAIATRSV